MSFFFELFILFLLFSTCSSSDDGIISEDVGLSSVDTTPSIIQSTLSVSNGGGGPPITTEAGSPQTTVALPTTEAVSPQTGPTNAQPTTNPSGPEPTKETTAPPSNTNPPIVLTTNVPITVEATTIFVDPFLDFNFTCTIDTCTYRLNSPQAGQYEAGTVNRGNQLAVNASVETYSLVQDWNSVDQSVDDFLNYLNQTYSDLVDQLNEIEEGIGNSSAALDAAAQNIAQLNSTLSGFPVRGCYYQSCLIASPPKPTTIATTRPTTPSVCPADYCTGTFCDISYNGTCLPVTGGPPTCQCIGNLNPRNRCQNVGCLSGTTTMYLDPRFIDAPFWSPNYDCSIGDDGTQPSYNQSIDCTWRTIDVVSRKKLINVVPADTNAIPNLTGATFSFITPQRKQPYIIRATNDACTLQKLLYAAVNKESPTWVQIQLQTDNTVPPNGAYFNWKIQQVDSPPLSSPSCTVGSG